MRIVLLFIFFCFVPVLALGLTQECQNLSAVSQTLSDSKLMASEKSIIDCVFDDVAVSNELYQLVAIEVKKQVYGNISSVSAPSALGNTMPGGEASYRVNILKFLPDYNLNNIETMKKAAIHYEAQSRLFRILDETGFKINLLLKAHLFFIARSQYIDSDFQMLSKAEVYAIYSYTSSAYQFLNAAIRETGLDQPAVKFYASILNGALLKLPRYKGPVTRYIEAYPSFEDSHCLRCQVDNVSFTSTSRKMNATLPGIPGPSEAGTYQLIMEVENGRSVKKLSISPEEDEILLPMNSSFEVIKIDPGVRRYFLHYTAANSSDDAGL